MAETQKVRELDLNNKEDRKYLKNLIKDRIKQEKRHQNAYEAYRGMKRGAKKYGLTVMSDGTIKEHGENVPSKFKGQVSDVKGSSSIKSNYETQQKSVQDEIDRKYKSRQVTYEEKSAPNRDSKSNSKSVQNNNSSASSEVVNNPKLNNKSEANNNKSGSSSTKPKNSATSGSSVKSGSVSESSKSNSKEVSNKSASTNSSSALSASQQNASTTNEETSQPVEVVTYNVSTPLSREYTRAFNSQHLGQRTAPPQPWLSNLFTSQETPIVEFDAQKAAQQKLESQYKRAYNSQNPKRKQEKTQPLLQRIVSYFSSPATSEVESQEPVSKVESEYQRAYRTQHIGERKTKPEPTLTRIMNYFRSFSQGGILKAANGNKLLNTYGPPVKNGGFTPANNFKRQKQTNDYYRGVYENVGLKSFDEVKRLQRILGVKDDGFIGEKTMNALKQYQFIDQNGKIRGRFDESGGFLPEWNRNGNPVVLYGEGVVHVPNTGEYGNFRASNGKFLTSNWGRVARPLYAQGGIIKAQQGAPIPTRNSQTPTLDAIINNPQLAESFLQVLSQQLGKEISMEDLITASQNPELAPQLEAIAQQVMKQSAQQGAKLQYISLLRGKCPEGQELVYFAKGGRICSACKGKKLEEGGKQPKYMEDFRKKQEAKKGCKLKK